MTLEQAIELGRRMMACEGFEWSEGMLALRCPDATFAPDGLVIRAYRDVPEIEVFDVRGGVKAGPASAWVPDPRDPGTVGHALAMMRASASPRSATPIDLWIYRDDALECDGWRVVDSHNVAYAASSATEIEAIVNAWEALS